jgi:hypothetical protein
MNKTISVKKIRKVAADHIKEIRTATRRENYPLSPEEAETSIEVIQTFLFELGVRDRFCVYVGVYK